MRLLRFGLMSAGAAFVLAACTGGPNFSTVGEKFANRAPATQAIAAAENASAPAGAYEAAAYEAYLGHAQYEFYDMQDFTDTIFHSNKALAAAAGQRVMPQQPSERVLTPEHAAETGEVYQRLMAAVQGEPGQRLPATAGRAVADFDCWLEQQEENFQPDDIAACRDAVYAALAELEAPVEEALPDRVSLSADVLFDFDRAEIKPEFTDEIDAAADLLLANPDVTVRIDGHTDNIGTLEYNQGLSERRAEAVASYLQNRGVSRDRMTVAGFSFTQPVADNSTAEGRAQNRRVEIDLIDPAD
jgi:OmpA-OmpF porin, OOP family